MVKTVGREGAELAMEPGEQFTDLYDPAGVGVEPQANAATASAPRDLFETAEGRIARRKIVYYKMLNADPDFSAALGSLSSLVRKSAGREHSEIQLLIAFASEWSLPFLAAQAARLAPTKGYKRDGTDSDLAFLSALDPTGVVVLQELSRTCRSNETPPTLRPSEGTQEAYDAQRASEGEMLLSWAGQQRGARGLRNLAKSEWAIVPRCPPPFLYSPRFKSPSWVREYATAVAEAVKPSILEQADQIERREGELGARRVSPRYLGSDALERGAQRLFLAAVKRLSFEQIAQGEDAAQPDGPDGEEWADVDSIRKTVRDWADILQVELPRVRPGRPRKSGRLPRPS